MRTLAALSTLVAVVATGGGCGGPDAPPTAPVPTAAPPASDAPPASSTTAAVAPAEPAAHKLFVDTNACWFGGLWGDAERDTPESKKAFVEARCNGVVRAIYGSEDKTRAEQLRAYEGTVVGDLAAKIETLAAADPKEAARKSTYGTLVKATASAGREVVEARRAGQRVKRDLDHEPEKLTTDEASAVGPLMATKEMEALLALDVGDLSADARAIGLIDAMDRIAISRGLPKHLKVYALSGTTKALFGVAAPADLPSDATASLKKGTYLAYLTDVAKAAGHPVSDRAKTPRMKDALAWSGVLQGVADKIKANAEKLQPGDLLEVSLRIANRLSAWHDAEEAALVSLEKSGDPKATNPPKK